MKTIYFECGMGASGDMLMASLLELCEDKQSFIDKLNAAGIPGVAVTSETSTKCGITGTHVRVTVDGREEDCCDDVHHEDHNHHTHDDNHHHEHDHHHEDDNHHHDHDHHHTHNNKHHHEHAHNDYQNIERIINNINVSDCVKQNTLAIYALIADAESHAHGVPVSKIHFHEVGEMDAVADIVGVCMLIEELSPELILSSPINTGSGHARCAHGVLPVPAPATAHILRGVPIYSDQTNGELCTPTGAAILKHFAKKFCGMPTLSVDKIGYGMGKKDFKKANCVRAYFGKTIRIVSNDVNEYVTELSGNLDAAQTSQDSAGSHNRSGNLPPAHVTELSCNLDDMTPEAIAFAQELLMQEGALDVWTTHIGMKKSRPAITLSCLCHNDVKDKMVALIFKHTTTLGVKEIAVRRYALHRDESELETEYGAIKIKTSRGFGVERMKAEYEDIARVARENGKSIDEVLNLIWAQ